MDVFADSNLFLAYATDFEPNHAKAEEFFHRDFRKFSGLRVRMELSKLKRRRLQLYDDLIKFFKKTSTLNNFVPSVNLKENDLLHLRQLLKHLSKMNKNQVLPLLRKIGRIIELGIKYAFSLLSGKLAKLSSDLVCQKHLENIVRNAVDRGILVDALCWAEEEHYSAIIFCTEDYKDVVQRRDQIYKKICQVRGYSIQELPLEIKSLDELLN